jgi:RNA polymerase sigma-70 factor (ECF subfamily)
MTNTSTEALDLRDMERLAAGQDAGLDNLMERYGQRLYRYVLRLLRDKHEAEEIVQETFVRVYQYRARFDPRHRFSCWVYRITTNLARDHLRRRQRRPEVPLIPEDSDGNDNPRISPQDPARDPGESLVAQETGEMVRSAVLALPDELRIPLVLSEYDELTHGEIGVVMDCTAKAVEMRLYRARQTLRAKLTPLLANTPSKTVRGPRP